MVRQMVDSKLKEYRQMVDSKLKEYRLASTDAELSTRDKQPVSVKKSQLRDLQNDSKTKGPNPIGNSPFSGSKRPSAECPIIPPRHKPASTTSTSKRLVYVRRKPEPDSSRSRTCNGSGMKAETHQSDSPLRERKVSCFPASAPFPMASPVNTPGKPSVYWEDRFVQLQILLRRLDQSDQDDYLQFLRSISSVELSRHAVELEKRSIQLSLEEAKEMQRVAVLNVLGKSTKLAVAHQRNS